MEGATILQSLHYLGLRKFLLAGVGPLGCIPNQISRGLFPSGVCVDRLRSLVDELNTQYSGSSIFVYGNTYAALMQIIQNPIAYGFVVTGRACCGVGSFQGRISMKKQRLVCVLGCFSSLRICGQNSCSRAFNGLSSDCYPINASQMALLFFSYLYFLLDKS
ncbi:hypothetical protein HN51_047072 [Arachis hypogaea]|uniref:GDSL esterase/lipase n=1 Tax=Arachis hypogaea TaxID=3818 RepID=A0A445AFA7_ARAHY|nr:hypothetical protein Ahy_B02g058710 [Arachis hypogaea]